MTIWLQGQPIVIIGVPGDSGTRAIAQLHTLGGTVVESLVITNLDEPSLVYGMHGGEKLAQWKVLARRNSLFGDWEAVEWSWLPPGGVNGEHLHTRTEELYFIVSGTGIMAIDGQEYPVSAGDLILTGLGTRHGLRNPGADELVWLVIEVMAPGMAPHVLA